MFGYIKPFKPQLRMCEFDTYQAVYCGLCKQLSRAFGPFARMTLSYDFTFLALLDMALREEPPQFERERCLYNPLKKKHCCQQNESLHFGACAAMVMLYYKVRDNISDEGYPKKLLYRLALPFAARARAKALAQFGDVDAEIGRQMKIQAQLEQNNCDSVDRAGEPTANCLAFLFARMSSQEGQRRVLRRFGYLLGRWVYLMDALDDLQEDKERGRYNPFLRRAAGTGATLEALRQEALLSLNLTVGEIIKAFALLDLRRYGDILKNVVEQGLQFTACTVLGAAPRRDGAGKEKRGIRPRL